MNQRDKNYYDSVLNSMALRIYSLKDTMPDEELAESMIAEHEQYIFEKARDIFTAYREATTMERLFMAMQGINLAKKVANEEREEIEELGEDPYTDEEVENILKDLGF